MKRSFFFGLATFLILGAVYELATVVPAIIQVVQGDRTHVAHVLITVTFSLLMALIGIAVVPAARRAPPHRTWWHALIGWLLGFFVLDIVILMVAAIIAGVRALLPS
jgi:hypothetical protein